MSNKLLGIDVYRESVATPEHELGMTVQDVRGGAGPGSISFKEVIDGTTITRRFFPDARYRYVKAGEAIALGEALVVSLADADEPYTLVKCSAANQVIVALAHTALDSGEYGWVQVEGRHHAAVKVAAAVIAAGDKLTSSATAGKLNIVTGDGDSNVTSTKLNAAIAMAAGIGIQALDSADSNNSTVEVLITH